MREELLRVAKLPYKPDQNAGVLITAAALWRRHANGAQYRFWPN